MDNRIVRGLLETAYKTKCFDALEATLEDYYNEPIYDKLIESTSGEFKDYLINIKQRNMKKTVRS